MPSDFLLLETPIEKIKRVGPAYGAKLKKLGIKTVRDLFYHLPHRYEDYSKILPLQELREGEACTVIGQIQKTLNIREFQGELSL